MKEVLIEAGELREGDVIGGQRVNHKPIVKGRKGFEKVHVFLVSPNGYVVKHRKFKVMQDISVKRPKYNLTKEQAKDNSTKVLSELNLE